MAEHLANIFGTEKDRVNCPFYLKMGCCRHGDRCSRTHNKPAMSPTILIPHMYTNPKAIPPPVGPDGRPGPPPDRDFLQDHFDNFYEDIFLELSRFGEIDELHVCDNVAPHMLGNVFVKYFEEEGSMKALDNLRGRKYESRQLAPEYSPVTDFRDAHCRQFDEGRCDREGYCNFMHQLQPNRRMKRELYDEQRRKHHSGSSRGSSSRERRRSRSSERSRSKERDRDIPDDRKRRRSPSPNGRRSSPRSERPRRDERDYPREAPRYDDRDGGRHPPSGPGPRDYTPGPPPGDYNPHGPRY